MALETSEEIERSSRGFLSINPSVKRSGGKTASHYVKYYQR